MFLLLFIELQNVQVLEDLIKWDLSLEFSSISDRV